MDERLYGLLAARARGRCECCGQPCGAGPFDRPTVDHFFGRSRADETEFTCWVLRADHHEAKTQNRPSAAHWLLLFIRHCGQYRHGDNGYTVAAEQAQKKLEWLLAKGTTAA